MSLGRFFNMIWPRFPVEVANEVYATWLYRAKRPLKYNFHFPVCEWRRFWLYIFNSHRPFVSPATVNSKLHFRDNEI